MRRIAVRVAGLPGSDQTRPVRTCVTSLVSSATVAIFVAAWTSVLPPVFGNPSLAGAWVGCATLIALASGVLYASKRGRVTGGRARMSGMFLVAAAASALAALLLLEGLEGVYASLIPGFPGAALASLVGAVMVAAVLFVPGFLTAAGLALEGLQPSRDAGLLLLGAAAGTVAAGYLLVPELGPLGSAGIGACGLGATGCAALLGRPRTPADVPTSGDSGMEQVADGEAGGGAPAGADGAGAHRTSSAIAYAAIGVIVFSLALCAMIWTEAIGRTAGTGVLARASLTGFCFAAAGLGALATARYAGDARQSTYFFGLAAGLSGLLWLGLVFFAERIGLLLMWLLGGGPFGWQRFAAAHLGVASVWMLLPCLAMGSSLPLAWRTLAPRGRPAAAERGGLVAALLGWLAACLVAAALPSPGFTLRAAAITFAWPGLACGCGLMVYAAGQSRSRPTLLALPALVAAAAVALSLAAPRWNQGTATVDLHERLERPAGGKVMQSEMEPADVVFYEESPGHVTAVSRTLDGLALTVNGDRIGTSSGDLPSQVLAAQVPLILAREPKTVLLLGLGTGITAGSAETHPITRLDCIEANPSAPTAAKLFATYNHNALQDPRLETIACDPLNYLVLTPNRYDVVISAQTVLGRDLPLLARSRLSPAGIFCQVAEMDKMDQSAFKAMAEDAARHFPHVGLWWLGRDRLLLAASMVPLNLPADALLNKLTARGIKNDLTRVGTLDDVGFLSLYMMDREALLAWAAGIPADSRAGGFSRRGVPWRPQGTDAVGVIGTLAAERGSPESIVAGFNMESPAFVILASRLSRCLGARTLYFKFLSAAREGRLREAAGYLDGAAGSCPENGIFSVELCNFGVSYSRALMEDGRFSDALNAARRALDANPNSYLALYNLAALEAMRNPDAAITLLRQALHVNPDYLAAYLLLAETQLAAGEIEGAGETLAQVLSIEPLNAGAHHLRALCFVRRHLLENARTDLELVIEAEPRNAAALSAMAYTWFLAEDLSTAERYYRRALDADPQNLEVLNNLGTVLAEKLQYREAVEMWERALKLAPGNQDIQENLREARQKIGQP